MHVPRTERITSYAQRGGQPADRLVGKPGLAWAEVNSNLYVALRLDCH